MGKAEEYYQRIIRLKPIIEADAEILRKAGTFIYSMSMYRSFPSDVISLGMGRTHGVAGVGIIVDSSTNQEIYLAVRVNHHIPYRHERMLASQIGAYETAFETGRDPPYFIGAVKAETEAGMIYGMIMEDVSHAQQLQLRERPDDECCEVLSPEGTWIQRFIDPGWLEESDKVRGRKYLDDIARIDVRL